MKFAMNEFEVWSRMVHLKWSGNCKSESTLGSFLRQSISLCDVQWSSIMLHHIETEPECRWWRDRSFFYLICNHRDPASPINSLHCLTTHYYKPSQLKTYIWMGLDSFYNQSHRWSTWSQGKSLVGNETKLARYWGTRTKFAPSFWLDLFNRTSSPGALRMLVPRIVHVLSRLPR